MSYEQINGACYQTHSFRCELPKDFVPTLPISSDNLESLPFLIHKEAIPLIELFNLNPPNSRSLINWALEVETIELQNLNQATEIQIAKFKEFLSSLEDSMIVTKQRGLEMLQTIAPEHLPKLNKKLKGVQDFEDKIKDIRNGL